jgi:hypothetical protein
LIESSSDKLRESSLGPILRRDAPRRAVALRRPSDRSGSAASLWLLSPATTPPRRNSGSHGSPRGVRGLADRHAAAPLAEDRWSVGARPVGLLLGRVARVRSRRARQRRPAANVSTMARKRRPSHTSRRVGV